MTLKPTTCTFCQKSVVLPCDSSGSADRCSQYRTAGQLGEAAVAKAVQASVDQTPTPAAPQAAPVAPSFTEDDAVALLRKASQAPAPSPLTVQIGGSHYKNMPIQPLVYSEMNNLSFTEASVVKYVSRWQSKNGIEDLKKARDMLDKKIALEQARADVMEKLSAIFAAL
jgi:hypothetical protein